MKEREKKRKRAKSAVAAAGSHQSRCAFFLSFSLNLDHLSFPKTKKNYLSLGNSPRSP